MMTISFSPLYPYGLSDIHPDWSHHSTVKGISPFTERWHAILKLEPWHDLNERNQPQIAWFHLDSRSRISKLRGTESGCQGLEKAGNRKVKVKVARSCLPLWDPWTSPWNSPGQNTGVGVGSHSLLQGIFPTQGIGSGCLMSLMNYILFLGW